MLSHPILWISFMTFMINVSFVMVYSLSTLYMKLVIGLSLPVISLLTHGAEGLSYALKLFSGFLSDRLHKRKSIVLTGYMCVILSRVFFFLPPCGLYFLLAKFLERIGNGIQATPVEAWVADIAPPKQTGQYYGFKRSMGMLGAFLGGIVAYLFLQSSPFSSAQSAEIILMMSTIPALIALFILCFFLREPAVIQSKAFKKIEWSDTKLIGRPFWFLMVVVTLLTVGRSIEPLIVIYLNQHAGLKLSQAPLIILVYNALYAIVSYPIGYYADRYTPLPFLFGGIIISCISYLTFIFTDTFALGIISISLFGAYLGITQNILPILIAKLVPSELRGTSFGLYYLITSIVMVLCGPLFGLCAEYFNLHIIFGLGIFFSVVALIFLAWKRKYFYKVV